MIRPVRPVLVALVACGLTLTGCGGSGSDDASGGADAGPTTTVDPGADACPDETTYTITGPDGDQTFTAASAFARESSDYLSLFLFSKDFPEDEIASIDTGFITDDPGTVFVSLHPRSGTGEAVTPIPVGTYEADSPEAQQVLEAGSWITTVTASLGLEQVASGFPPDPATTVDLAFIDDERVCGTITHPDVTATFSAVHLTAS